MLDANAPSSEKKGVIQTLQRKCNLKITAPNDISSSLE